MALASCSGVKEVGPQHPPPKDGLQHDDPVAGCCSADHDPAVAMRA
jgi:hypothetical protein